MKYSNGGCISTLRKDSAYQLRLYVIPSFSLCLHEATMIMLILKGRRT